MGVSQGFFDGLGIVASGENEAQVFVALRKWYDFLAHGYGDRHIVDTGDPLRGLEPPHGLEHAGLGNGNHHQATHRQHRVGEGQRLIRLPPAIPGAGSGHVRPRPRRR